METNKIDNMKTEENTVSSSEAKAALAMLKENNTQINNKLRPPVLLTIVWSIFIGIAVLNVGTDLAFPVLNYVWPLLLLFCCAYQARSVKSLEAQGIKYDYSAKSKRGVISVLLVSVLLVVAIVASLLMFLKGITWVPYIAALLSSLGFGYWGHNYLSLVSVK